MALENFDEIIENPQYQELAVDSLRKMVEMMPDMAEKFPVAEEALQAFNELSNPEAITEKFKEFGGIIKLYLVELRNLLNDPLKLSEIIEQLPPEFATILDALQSGDMSIIKDLVREFPGTQTNKILIY
jgi:hypothetical protein